jgi:hypothetical protein
MFNTFVILISFLLVIHSARGQTKWTRVASSTDYHYYIKGSEAIDSGFDRAWIKQSDEAGQLLKTFASDSVYLEVLDERGFLNGQRNDKIPWLDSVRARAEAERRLQHYYDTVEDYTIELDQYDCKARRNRILSMAKYFLSGRVENVDIQDPKWTYVFPETVGEAMLDFVCSHAKKAKR